MTALAFDHSHRHCRLCCCEDAVTSSTTAVRQTWCPLPFRGRRAARARQQQLQQPCLRCSHTAGDHSADLYFPELCRRRSGVDKAGDALTRTPVTADNHARLWVAGPSPVSRRMCDAIAWLDGHAAAEGLYRIEGNVDEIADLTCRIMSGPGDGESELFPKCVRRYHDSTSVVDQAEWDCRVLRGSGDSADGLVCSTIRVAAGIVVRRSAVGSGAECVWPVSSCRVLT